MRWTAADTDTGDCTRIDPQFQGIGGHDGLQIAGLQVPLHLPSNGLGQGAVMGVGQQAAFLAVDQVGQFFA